LPLDLISRIVRFRVAENLRRADRRARHRQERPLVWLLSL
jgi:hypothetical protein